MTPLFQLRSIKQIYAGRTVLDIPALDLPSRKVLGIFGPNGSGKSTLLRLLALVEDPAEGQLLFKGRACSTRDEQERRRIVLLDQSPYLLKRSVYGNVAYGLKIRGREDQNEVDRALELVGLDPDRFSRRKWYHLSGGEAQRVALAARLALKPEVLLLDEPTANVDAASTDLIRQAVLTAKRRWNASVILVSHDQHWLSEVSQTTLTVRDGRLAQSG
jgi:tungstate transport system ATP-binding protein